jgi:hypothetical protein
MFYPTIQDIIVKSILLNFKNTFLINFIFMKNYLT